MIDASGSVAEVVVHDRRDYFEITDEDLERLRSLRSFFERHIDHILERMHEFLARHPQSHRFLPDAATVARVKSLQKRFFLGFLTGSFDAEYVGDRRRVGETAERIGLPPTLYIGAYAVFMRGLQDCLHEEFSDPVEANLGFNSFRKLAFLDQALTIETYVAASERTIERQQLAIRELSTPVIEVHEGILLVPLVGAIDEARAEQLEGTLLRAVKAKRARVVILDISGVHAVDTHLAHGLLQTASSARLLGARPILSGVSSAVAQSIVKLSIDTSGLATVGELSAAIALAYQTVGLRVSRV